MDYSEARSLLDALPRRVKPGLDRINRLVDALGRPEQRFPAVHIAGTNGKGSVAAMVSAILRASGYRVGRFTSPDLIDFRDRIEVNGSWIPEPQFAAVVNRLAPLLATTNDSPTMFEVLTAVAFSHFADEHVDIAVVEVGLGGRYDATNIVRPTLSVVTTVGRDHMDILGDTIAQIAWEKVGIAKRSVPLVVGRLSPDAGAVVTQVARDVGAPIIRADAVTVDEVRRDLTGATYRISGPGLPDTVTIPLPGSYERDNLRVVLAVIVALRNRGWDIPTAAITTGLRTVTWPGRFEVVHRAPTIVLDGAHNLPGVQALARDITYFFPERTRRSLLFGVLADKEFAAMAGVLFPLFPRIVLTQSDSARALPTAALVPLAVNYEIQPIVTKSVAEGLTRAQTGLSANDVLIITGSLTVVRAARRDVMEAAKCRN